MVVLTFNFLLCSTIRVNICVDFCLYVIFNRLKLIQLILLL